MADDPQDGDPGPAAPTTPETDGNGDAVAVTPEKKSPSELVEDLLKIIEAQGVNIEIGHLIRLLKRLTLKTYVALFTGLFFIAGLIFSLGAGSQLFNSGDTAEVERQPISALVVANVERPEDSNYLSGELGRLVVRDLDQGAGMGDAVLIVSCQPLPHAATPITAKIKTDLNFEMSGYAFLHAAAAPKELVPRQAKPLTAGQDLTALQFSVDGGNKDDILIFLVRLKPTPNNPIPERPQELIKLFEVKVMS